jgi:hypothetical protein
MTGGFTYDGTTVKQDHFSGNRFYPNNTGYKAMADVWYRFIQNDLK